MLVGVGSPPFLIPAQWNIGIFRYKQAKLHKDTYATQFSRPLLWNYSSIFLGLFFHGIC